MSVPFLAEVKIVPFNFPPKGWAFCNGQSLPIAQNQALFALLGTSFGGDGVTTFALPNLQGRTPIGTGQGGGLPNYPIGANGGEAMHTLTANEMPQHNHGVLGSSAPATVTSPTGGMLAVPLADTYLQASPGPSLSGGTVGNAGSGQPHENRQPFLILSFVIALQGIFPSRS